MLSLLGGGYNTAILGVVLGSVALLILTHTLCIPPPFLCRWYQKYRGGVADPPQRREVLPAVGRGRARDV